MEFGAGRQRRPHYFQGHHALQVRVFRLEDDPHGAGPQNFQDAIRAEPAQFVRILRRRQEGVVGARGQIEGVGDGGRRILRGGWRMESALAGGSLGGRGDLHDQATAWTRLGSPGHAVVYPERRAAVGASEGNHVMIRVGKPMDRTGTGRGPESLRSERRANRRSARADCCLRAGNLGDLVAS